MSRSLTSRERLDDIFLARFGVVAGGLLVPMGDADGGEDIVDVASVLVVVDVVDGRLCGLDSRGRWELTTERCRRSAHTDDSIWSQYVTMTNHPRARCRGR